MDPPDEPVGGQDAECVVHCLTRNPPDLVAHVFRDLFRRRVRTARHRPQVGQALGRDVHATLTKLGSRVRSQECMVRPNLHRVQSLTNPISTLLAVHLVQSARVETIKIGKGKKAKKETRHRRRLQRALNAASADNAGRLRARLGHQGQGERQRQKPQAGDDQAGRARASGLGC